MLGGERTVGLVDELAPKPTFAQTFEAAKSKTTVHINLLSQYILPSLYSEQTKQKTGNKLSYINEILNDPRQSYAQQGVNVVGEIVGSIIPILLILTIEFEALSFKPNTPIISDISATMATSFLLKY